MRTSRLVRTLYELCSLKTLSKKSFMISPAKKLKLQTALKAYKKQYLDRKHAELDESGTRIMINSFLSEVLGYKPLEEIKTEYMIRGTYADYVVQLDGTRHFLVEVKAVSLDLSEKHLRQTINYGANEGIEYALLTNGRTFDFYKILFDKPIAARRIFSVDLSDMSHFKTSTEYLQYLHRDSAVKKGFQMLWNKCEATDPMGVAGVLLSVEVVSLVRKLIKLKYEERCNESDILKSIQKVITEKIDLSTVKPFKTGKSKQRAIRKKSDGGLPEAEMIRIMDDAVLPSISDVASINNSD